MQWCDAYNEMKKGIAIQRAGWVNQKYLSLLPGMQTIFQVTPNGAQGANVSHWLPTIPDYDAQDWDTVSMEYVAPVEAKAEDEAKAA